MVNTSMRCLRMMTLVVFIAACCEVTAFSPLKSAAMSRWALHRCASRLHMATWSDARAVREYQDFLATGKSEPEKAEDGAAVIVAPSRGSTALADALKDLGQGDDIVVTPGQDLPDSLGGSESYPIYVTIPPTELDSFLKTMPETYQNRRDDLVFFSGGLQYGNIEGVLKNNGCCRDYTSQVLISGMALTPRVQDVSVRIGTASNGEEKWAGECAACGKWGGAIEQRLESNAIRCKIFFYREWKRHMWERNVYDAVFHLVGAIRDQPTSLSDVALYYDNEVSDIVWEISSFLRGSRALTLTYGFEERMFGIAEGQGSDQPCTLVDEMYPFLYEQFEMATTFMEYLAYAQDERGLLSTVNISRKSKTKMDKPPIMRQGSLRADGVI